MDLLVEAIGILAAVLTSSGFLPQLFKSYKTKKLDDVSYLMPIVLALGMTLWFIYGYLIFSIAVMAANVFSISCCIFLIIIKRKYS